MRSLVRLLLKEEGQDLVEYALLASLIAIVSVAALRALGPKITAVFTTINSKF